MKIDTVRNNRRCYDSRIEGVPLEPGLFQVNTYSTYQPNQYVS